MMIEIDGSFGEGGGQILRTALGLSCLFNKPCRIYNVRKGRKKPGLMPQHLICVKAARLISGATVTGDYVGSTEIIFSPREIKGGNYSFDIGTAGSTSLVLQTIVPALIHAYGRSTVVLHGGTHVPFSPTFHYVSEVFAPILAKIGITVKTAIESYGFYPKGGGSMRAEIYSERRIKPLILPERGRILTIQGCSGAGNLPLSVAERQRNTAIEKISSQLPGLHCPASIETASVKTPGTGTFIFIKAESEYSIAGFASLGERGKRAEIVGEDVAMEFIDYYNSNAALDSHMSDQIVPYLSLCGEMSAFTTSSITDHLMTNLWVTGLFCQYEWSVEGEKGSPGKVVIGVKSA